MKCHEFQELIDAYLGETIAEVEREPFEEHFFSCRQCFLGLKINESLRGKEVRIPLPERPRLFAFKVFRPALVMASLFLLIVFSALLVQRGQRQDRLRELARFDLPLYHQGEMRGDVEGDPALEQAFARAMRLYQEHDLPAALAVLDGPALAAADMPKIAFFRAICYLELNRAAEAEATFDVIIRAMDPAYFDEALFYKGFALLRQGRRREARDLFAKLAGMLSPMAGRAQGLVQKIDEL